MPLAVVLYSFILLATVKSKDACGVRAIHPVLMKQGLSRTTLSKTAYEIAGSTTDVVGRCASSPLRSAHDLKASPL